MKRIRKQPAVQSTTDPAAPIKPTSPTVSSPANISKPVSSFVPNPKPTSTFAPASGPLNVKAIKPDMTPAQWNELIRKKAYELYEKHGRTPGNELSVWLEAEKLVRQEMRR